MNRTRIEIINEKSWLIVSLSKIRYSIFENNYFHKGSAVPSNRKLDTDSDLERMVDDVLFTPEKVNNKSVNKYL